MLASESDGQLTRAGVKVNASHVQSLAFPLPDSFDARSKILHEIFLVERRCGNGGKCIYKDGVAGIGAYASEAAPAAAEGNGDDAVA